MQISELCTLVSILSSDPARFQSAKQNDHGRTYLPQFRVIFAPPQFFFCAKKRPGYWWWHKIDVKSNLYSVFINLLKLLSKYETKLVRFVHQQMAQLATDYMENHGIRFLKQCVPVRIDKADNGLLHVTWEGSVTGESYQETFETVLFAIGKSFCGMNFF